MASLVLELQAQALDANIAITDLLRKVKVVAAKLGLDDTLQWVTYELDGYPEDNSIIPDYREIHGTAKGLNPVRGWQRIIFDDAELEQKLSTQKSRQSISEIQQIAKGKGGVLTFTLSNKLMDGLQYATDARIFVAESQIARILDSVRNRVLDWALDLEKEGILGEGMSFTPEEKKRATDVTYNISTTNHIAGSVGILGDVTDSTVTQNVGGPPIADLVAALVALRDFAAASDDPKAPVVAATVDQVLVEAKSASPNRNVLERLIMVVAATAQGIAAAGPAWTAVVTEAAKFGIHLALPAGL